MDVQKNKLVNENKEILSRLVAAKPSITPFSKLQTDYKKHRKMVKSIQKLQKVQQTVILKTDHLHNTIQGFNPLPSKHQASTGTISQLLDTRFKLANSSSVAKIPVKNNRAIQKLKLKAN